MTERQLIDLMNKASEGLLDYIKLHEAVKNLYYAGVWKCDRPVDEAALWTAVRDAAGFEPGKSPKPLDNCTCRYIYGQGVFLKSWICDDCMRRR